MTTWTAPTSRRSFARLLGASTLFSALSPLGGRAQAAPGSDAAAVPEPSLTPGPIRLSSNENPYGPPPAALAALAAATASLDRIARYPDQAEDELVQALAAEHEVANEAIALGAGSSQILHAAAAAFSGPSAAAAVALPTFEALGRYAELRGARVERVALTDDFRHDLDAMAHAVGARGLVYLCNPNNPTATLTPAAQLRALMERLPPSVVMLVDEAYHGYAQGEPGYESVVPWIARFPNLVVARTFSKIYGMAGLRCGYAIGDPARIAELKSQLPWDSANVMALVAARAALGDSAHLDRSHALNREVRANSCAALTTAGLRCLPSAANFFMVDLGSDAGPVIERLLAAGVRVGRRFAALPHYLRVTVGTADEMRAFLVAFANVHAILRAA